MCCSCLACSSRDVGSDARAWAAFVPDCLVLFKLLVQDPRVSRARKALLLALIAYLAMPLDFVPDFIPIAGQLDDAIVVAIVLRAALRGSGANLVREHWPGPQSLASSNAAPRRRTRKPVGHLRRVGPSDPAAPRGVVTRPLTPVTGPAQGSADSGGYRNSRSAIFSVGL